MDEEQENALFARVRQSLDAIRREAASARPDVMQAAPTSDPEVAAALARVENSLRTLASNLEAVARRADGLDAAMETRIETSVERATADLRAEIELLSTRTTLPEPPTIAEPVTVSEPPRVSGDPHVERVRPTRFLERPVASEPVVEPPGRRRGLFMIGVAVLALVGGGIAAARLGVNFDPTHVRHTIEAKWSAWRPALFAAVSSDNPAHATQTAQLAPPAPQTDAAPQPSTPAAVTDLPPPPPAPPAPAPAQTASTAPQVDASTQATTPAAVTDLPPPPPAAPAPSQTASTAPPAPPALAPSQNDAAASPPPAVSLPVAPAVAAPAAEPPPPTATVQAASPIPSPPPAPPTGIAESPLPAPTNPASPPPVAAGPTSDLVTTPPEPERPAVPSPVMELRATGPVWVEVRQSPGHVLLRRTLHTGDTWPVPASSGLLLSTGNVRNLEFMVNGEARALPHGRGGVLRDAPLDGTS